MDQSNNPSTCSCTICGTHISSPSFTTKKQSRSYFTCSSCDFIFLHPSFYLTSKQEHEHYKKHDNNVEDKGYQDFVMPLVDMIRDHIEPDCLGLDYGCGPGPVIQYLLSTKGFQIQLYDLFFHPDKKVLNQKYDYIILSEVAEHFQKPVHEFEKIFALLKPKGKLFVMTALTDKISDFPSWHYHRDPTHVSFYSTTTLDQIAKKFGKSVTKSDHNKCILIS